MALEPDDPKRQLTSREPSVEDVADLCRALNERDAKYLVIGGFAMRAAGFDRRTMDVDLLIETSLANEAKVYDALRTLPDQAVTECDPGDVKKYNVVRVADDILVDLMCSACGIEYADAEQKIVYHDMEGVSVPFASPQLLWDMKVNTHREKDAGDLWFLRRILK